MRLMDRHTYEMFHDEAAHNVMREFSIVLGAAAIILTLYHLIYRVAF